MQPAKPIAQYARVVRWNGHMLICPHDVLSKMARAGKNRMLVPLIAAVMLPSLGISTSYIHYVGSDVFLFVETVGDMRTTLVEGNYTGGHICFDFPTYSVDEASEKVHQFAGSLPGHYRLAYGSGFFAGGLVSSGGASGLVFIDELPFTAREDVSDGNTTFTVKVTVTERLEVLLEGGPFDVAFRLDAGTQWKLPYDTVKEHQNAGDGCSEGSVCKIGYTGKTTITNHGFWARSNVEFD
jgi:hypothetical protein